MSNTVTLQADVTANDEADQALLQRFGVFGPPTIIFFGTDGQQRHGYEVVGYMKAKDFTEHLQQAFSLSERSAERECHRASRGAPTIGSELYPCIDHFLIFAVAFIALMAGALYLRGANSGTDAGSRTRCRRNSGNQCFRTSSIRHSELTDIDGVRTRFLGMAGQTSAAEFLGDVVRTMPA